MPTLALTASAIPVLYLAAVTPALTRTDIRQHRLPNRMVVPGIAIGLVSAALQWSVVPLVAALGFGGFLWLLGLAGGIGMGDVKLATLIGLASPTVPVAVLAPVFAFLAGGVAATIVLIRRGRGARIPFGPFLLAGYWIAVAVGLASSITAGVP